MLATAMIPHGTRKEKAESTICSMAPNKTKVTGAAGGAAGRHRTTSV